MIPPHLHRPALKDYLYGFIFAVMLTVAAFYMVMHGDISKMAILVIVSLLAAIQILVHIRYFLHYSTKRTPFEASVALTLAGGMAIVLVTGGLLVMIDLHHRMMPM